MGHSYSHSHFVKINKIVGFVVMCGHAFGQKRTPTHIGCSVLHEHFPTDLVSNDIVLQEHFSTNLVSSDSV